MKTSESVGLLVEDGIFRIRAAGAEPTGVLMNPRTLSQLVNEYTEVRLEKPDVDGELRQRFKIAGLPIKEKREIAHGDAVVVSADEWRKR